EQAGWLDRLEIEHDELRAALAWSLETDVPAAVRLGGALGRFWQVRGHVREGRGWLERIISAAELAPSPAADRDLARALNAAAFLAFLAGDYEQAAARYRETLAARRQFGDAEGVAESLNSLGLTLRCMGDHAAADALFGEALAANRALGNRAREANILNNLARSAFYRGDDTAALALHEQALAVGRAAGELWAVAICLGDIGDVYQARGDLVMAGRLYESSLTEWLALGDLRGVAQCLEGFAGLLADTQTVCAVRLFGAAAAIRDRIAEPSSPMRRESLRQTMARACLVLGADRYAVAWTDGRALSPEQAVTLARACIGTA
ncbi:MAG: tetratricopeptide repeat protein, partial [Solirubrobacterales bacterium]|nr:tetratricopeptide repeat protein [Solirubrobacterales bacterium]